LLTSIIRLTRIDELETTLVVTSNRSTLWLQVVVVPSLPIIVPV
jgi:hypothetical protein